MELVTKYFYHFFINILLVACIHPCSTHVCFQEWVNLRETSPLLCLRRMNFIPSCLVTKSSSSSSKTTKTSFGHHHGVITIIQLIRQISSFKLVSGRGLQLWHWKECDLRDSRRMIEDPKVPSKILTILVVKSDIFSSFCTIWRKRSSSSSSSSKTTKTSFGHHHGVITIIRLIRQISSFKLVSGKGLQPWHWKECDLRDSRRMIEDPKVPSKILTILVVKSDIFSSFCTIWRKRSSSSSSSSKTTKTSFGHHHGVITIIRLIRQISSFKLVSGKGLQPWHWKECDLRDSRRMIEDPKVPSKILTILVVKSDIFSSFCTIWRKRSSSSSSSSKTTKTSFGHHHGVITIIRLIRQISSFKLVSGRGLQPWHWKECDLRDSRRMIEDPKVPSKILTILVVKSDIFSSFCTIWRKRSSSSSSSKTTKTSFGPSPGCHHHHSTHQADFLLQVGFRKRVTTMALEGMWP